MKKRCVILFILLFAVSSHASDLSGEFKKKYKDLEPGVGSSVRSDYLFEQISLGSEYTIMLLDQIKDRNSDTNDKLDTLIEKLDILIDQNQKLIDVIEKNRQTTLEGNPQ